MPHDHGIFKHSADETAKRKSHADWWLRNLLRDSWRMNQISLAVHTELARNSSDCKPATNCQMRPKGLQAWLSYDMCYVLSVMFARGHREEVYGFVLPGGIVQSFGNAYTATENGTMQ